VNVLLVAFVALLVVLSACSQPGTGTSSPARVSGSQLAPASGRLDAEVAMPAGFPSDVPIYPRARLTAGASFASSGQVAWGMEWETLDLAPNVRDYYAKHFSQGDWMLSVTGQADVSWSATLTRKSNSHVTGTLGVNGDAQVTRILISLISPA